MKKILMFVVTLFMMTNFVYAGEISDILNSKPFYEQYEQVYKAGKYDVGKTIPEGDYFVFAEPGKFATVVQYREILKNGKKQESDFYYNTVEYNDYIVIDKSESVSVENGVLVPAEKVGKLDVTRNGVFRVGVDIPEGKYWLERDPDYQTGIYEVRLRIKNYVGYDYVEEKGSIICDVYTGGIIAFHKDRLLGNVYNNTDHGTIELAKKDRLLYKSGIDIFRDKNGVKGSLAYDHKKPVIKNTDLNKNIDFSAVRASYKQNAVNDFISMINESKKITREEVTKAGIKRYVTYTNLSSESNLDSKCKSLINSAQNESEKKFAEMITNLYFNFSSGINEKNIVISTPVKETRDKFTTYIGKIKVDDNAYLKALKTIDSAKSFEECQNAVNEILFMYNGGRIGYDDMTNSSDIYKLVHNK